MIRYLILATLIVAAPAVGARRDELWRGHVGPLTPPKLSTHLDGPGADEGA